MSNFQRQVALERARRTPCPVCGGTYRENLHRVWHEQSCPRWKSRPILQTPAEQDRERQVLTDACPHGIEPWTDCQGCAEEADRYWDEARQQDEQTRVEDEYERSLDALHRIREIDP